MHDERFVEAWRSQGFDVDAIVHRSSGSLGALRDQIASATPDVVQAGPVVDVGDDVACVWDGPLILTSWNFDLMDEALRGEHERSRAVHAISKASVLLTDNEPATERAVEWGMDRDGIIEFPWGISLAQFEPTGPSVRASLGWGDDAWVIGCTRRHEAYYDVATVVAAFAMLAERVPEARLLLAGDGSLTSALRDQVAQLGIDDRTAFLGAVAQPDVAPVYRAMSAYVSASHVDGTSVSMLEAMACGTPVCVADIAGNRPWLAGGTGLSFEAGSPADLARKLEGLRTDAHSADEMIARARTMVEQRADWDATRRRFREIAHRAVERRGMLAS